MQFIGPNRSDVRPSGLQHPRGCRTGRCYMLEIIDQGRVVETYMQHGIPDAALGVASRSSLTNVPFGEQGYMEFRTARQVRQPGCGSYTVFQEMAAVVGTPRRRHLLAEWPLVHYLIKVRVTTPDSVWLHDNFQILSYVPQIGDTIRLDVARSKYKLNVDDVTHSGNVVLLDTTNRTAGSGHPVILEPGTLQVLGFDK